MTRGILAATLLVILATGPARAQQIPRVQHVLVVLEANANYADVCGPNRITMPLLCGLKAQGGFSTNYFASTHPSIGNYEDLGWGVVSTNDDGCVPTTCGYSGDNIIREVSASGQTWKGYAESLPSPCDFGGDTVEYSVRHSPIPYTSDAQSNCLSRFIAFEDPNLGFAQDLANNALPNYAFITPNLCHDGIGCTLQGNLSPDQWLQKNVLQPLISSGHLNPATGDTVVIVTFDESSADNTQGGGAVYWFMMGRGVKQNYQSTGPAVMPNYYSHESSLRLTAELLGLDFSGLGGAAKAPDMTEFFDPGAAPNPPSAFRGFVVGTTAPNPPAGLSGTMTPIPPTISITAPASGDNVSGSISVTTSASVNTTSVQLEVDGNNSGAAVTSAPFTVSLNTGTLSNGSHLLTAIASNAAGQTNASEAIVVTVSNSSLAIITGSFPSGQVALSYSAPLQATDGVPPYTWSVFSGQLPDGLVLSSSTGIISGIPTFAGSFSFTAQVSDGSGTNSSAGFNINIATPPPPTPTAPFGHVVIVALENTNYSTVVGSTSMPYLNGLANQYGLATQYYSDVLSSIGAYFMWTTGQILTTSNLTPLTFPVSVDNAVRDVLASGKTWKQYAESLPSVGYLGGDATGPDGGAYAARHVPLNYMTDVQNSPAQLQNIVPFTQLAADLANSALPNYSFITPNLCDDAHDCSLSTADNWLKTNIDPLIKSAQFQTDGLLVIAFDESADDSTHGGGHVVAVVISPFSKPGYRSTTFYQGESVLRLMLEGLGIKTLPGAAATAPAMWEFFTFTPPS
jgi:phosphatidylinositol-3-phosphatase